MKVSLITLGCRVNQSESDTIEASLKDCGHNIVSIKDNPDICIVNTCSVTAESDHNSRQMIRRAVRAGARVIVTGCYSHLRPQEVSGITGVERIFDNLSKNDIVRYVIGGEAGESTGRVQRARPAIKIQDGCNYRCTYCAVPLARGNSRSIPGDEVVRRVVALDRAGYREVVLTGIHLGTYGHDLAERTTISGIVRRVLAETNIFRVRLSSIEVREIDDELLGMMSGERRLCAHLHIPLQSGSDSVLRAMGRCYSTAEYHARIEAIGKAVENVSVGTDVIVGFPGEGDAEFDETCRLLRSGIFSYLHVFPYSMRPGTPASRYGNVPERSVVRSRMIALKALDAELRDRYRQAQLGRNLEVVVEEVGPNGICVGTSANYLKVRVASCNAATGSVIHVRAGSVRDGMIEGDGFVTS